MKKNNKFNIQSKRNEIMWNGNGMLNLAKKGRRNCETVKFNQTKRNKGIMMKNRIMWSGIKCLLLKVSQSVSQSVYYAQKSAS